MIESAEVALFTSETIDFSADALITLTLHQVSIQTMKNVLITGASGMIGSLILQHCLSSNAVDRVTSLVRRSSGVNHPKLNEITIDDFNDYSLQQASFQDIDASFFCIGVYTGQVSDAKFKEITIDYAVAFAESLKNNSPNTTLCFLSGAGADRQEKSRVSFAKYKGIAENKIEALGLGGFYTFRPGYIYPVEPRNERSIGYKVLRHLYPVIRLMGNGASITSEELAHAMFHAGFNGADKAILENSDIKRIYQQDQ